MTATLKRIALTLARSKDFPDGSNQIGYDLVAPLNDDGHIDLPAWKKHRTACSVRHFSPAEDDRTGLLVHKAGGSLRDVQLLAGHRSIQTTQRYIEGDTDAQRKLVSMI